MTDNVIQFPKKDNGEEASVADALRTCIIFTAGHGVINEESMDHLLATIDTIEELYGNLVEEAE